MPLVHVAQTPTFSRLVSSVGVNTAPWCCAPSELGMTGHSWGPVLLLSGLLGSCQFCVSESWCSRYGVSRWPDPADHWKPRSSLHHQQRIPRSWWRDVLKTKRVQISSVYDASSKVGSLTGRHSISIERASPKRYTAVCKKSVYLKHINISAALGIRLVRNLMVQHPCKTGMFLRQLRERVHIILFALNIVERQ